jgi:hypothetical protein
LSRLRKARERQRDDSARAVGFVDDDAVALSGEESDQGRIVVLLVVVVVMQVCEKKIRRPLLLVVAVLRLPSPSQFVLVAAELHQRAAASHGHRQVSHQEARALLLHQCTQQAKPPCAFAVVLRRALRFLIRSLDQPPEVLLLSRDLPAKHAQQSLQLGLA